MSATNPPVAVSDAKDVRIVEFTNNKILDEANIKEIGDAIRALVEQRDIPKVLIDVNSKMRAKNGSLRLANIRPAIRDVFVITKLDKLFKILPTREEAMTSF